MSKETINQIREAEAQADRIIAQAEAKAAEMRAQAEAEGKELCRKTEETVAAEMAATMTQIREKTEERAGQLLELANEEAEAIAEASKLNRKMAEKLVIRGLDAKCR